MKAALIRLGIRGFNPKLKKAGERLDSLRTPEGFDRSEINPVYLRQPTCRPVSAPAGMGPKLTSALQWLTRICRGWPR
jgi:hypothetical protein